MGLLYGPLHLSSPFFRKNDLLIDNRTGSALGTPLAWPEAKERAGQVREWGIEVLPSVLSASLLPLCVVQVQEENDSLARKLRL